MGQARFRADGLEWWVLADAAPADAEARVRASGVAVPRAGRSDRKRRLFLALGAGGAPNHLLKIYRPAALRPRRRSKARRELELAEALGARGVPVGLPLAAGERRRAGRVVESRLLVPLLPGYVDLRTRLCAGGLGPRQRRRLAEALGALARRAHEAGLQHDDFTATNLLVALQDPGDLRLVDFERARLRPRLRPAARARMLARLERALGAEASGSERWRFLCAYTDGDRAAARRWWRRVAGAATGLARRDRRRLARDARRPRRRFRPLETSGWRGVMRSDACPERIARAAARDPHEARGGFGLGEAGDLWDLHYPKTSPRRGLGLFTAAGVLAEWGLAPRPLALLRRGRDHRILCERRPCVPLAPGAARPLLRRLARLGALEAHPGAELLAAEVAPDGRRRCHLLAPHPFHFARGRSVRAASIR